MAQETASVRQHSNAYNFFILALTLISLVIMVVMLLSLDDATIGLLQFYDILICVIFLIGLFLSLRAASRKSDYFIRERGWLDLLGSIPSLGVALRYSGLFRLARVSRLARITRPLGGKSKRT
jgi:voltage-gated potassium channel